MMNLHYCTMKRSNQLYLFFFLIFVSYYLSCLANGITTSSNNVMCFDCEREALLKFKEGIQVDHCGLLSSWVDHAEHNNCCLWHGIHCNNLTGHVTMLDLHGVDTFYKGYCLLQGNVSSSLVDLKHLTYLDLSLNNFQSQPIPNFIGSFVNLSHLNLSYSGFQGKVPNQLGNLSRLTSLDLSMNNGNLYIKNLSWLSRLTFLRYIDLNYIDLSKATNWLQIMNNLPHLRVLHLDGCLLPQQISWPLSYKNSTHTLSILSLKFNRLHDSFVFQWLFNLSGITTHLKYLDLSGNQLKGPIPAAFENMQALTYLFLSENQLEGPSLDTILNIKNLTHLDLSSNNFNFLPITLGNMCSLQELHLSLNNLTYELANIIQTLDGCTKKSLFSLDLSYNQIWGPIPDTIDTLPSLRELFLFNNHLNGTISQRLRTLSMLETLHLSSNFLKGTLSINHFSNLSRLKNLELYDNSGLVLDFNVDWVPPFQLDVIRLGSCRLGPMFPKWLLRQTNYSVLDIPETGISDSIPMSFWKSLPQNLRYLNMSHNNIYGTLPDLQKIVPNIYTETLNIDMSYNNIEGAIPTFPKNVTSIYLSSNMFIDPIPFLCPKVKTKLHSIDLSNNSLSGELPNCWIHFDQLMFLNVDNNSFSGSIPTALGYLEKLQLLHLGKNRFSKDIPRSLMNCTSLVNLNLGHNSLSGHIPIEIGYNLRNLSSLILKNNTFIGEIPLSICKLSSLQILDLSINHITGAIPKCIHNLTAMQNGTDLMPPFIYDEFVDKKTGYSVVSVYSEVETIMWKRKEWDFNTNNLGLLKAIDMSQNRLQGEIPFEISLLEGLVTLNLSRNHLHGNITAIGHLTSLNALDLSNNHLSGEIPTSLADLNSLGTLDLSNNHFSGKIPNGPHLETFDASSFTGNPELCGMPLPQCPWDQQPDNYRVNEDDDDHQDKSEFDDFFLGLYVSLVLGFIIGFWGVCGTLMLKRSRRHAFFRFFDDVKDKLYGFR